MNSPQTLKMALTRVISAGVNSYKGFVFLIRSEAAFRQESILFLGLFPVIFFLEKSHVEKLLLLSSLLIILIVEALNTAIEKTVDRISSAPHNLSGLAKDISSFAVLLSIVLAVIIWLVILL